ncbi:hypothetical protein M422DRAFT_23507 [Sphaerobolus stellatus SS14]|nr:hypothetical protein M422DRAFT_23507 [Sphaerobolus stellatus SS14]
MSARAIPIPLHNVPVEIIQEILVNAIHQSKALNKSATTSAITPNRSVNRHPYAVRAALLSVCKTWHRLVLNTPRMWNMLFFDGVLPASLDEVERWLRLSKACPLDVYVCLEKWFPIPRDVFVYRYTQSMVGNPRDLERVYEMLGGHMGRIRTLVLDLRHCRTACFPSLEVLFPSERCTKMKSLEALECVGSTIGRVGRIHAPRLQEVVTGYNLNTMLEHMTMDTVLSVKEVEVRIRDDMSAEQVEALGLYRNLESLHLIDTRIANAIDEGPQFPIGMKVVLPSLRFLDISALRAEVILPLLNTLSTPALESLSFEGCDGSTSLSTSTLSAFFALGPSIQELHLAGVDLRPPQHQHQDQQSSNAKLTSIHLSRCHIHTAFFQSLNATVINTTPPTSTSPSTSLPYPILSTLTFHNCTFDPTDLKSFNSNRTHLHISSTKDVFNNRLGPQH